MRNCLFWICAPALMFLFQSSIVRGDEIDDQLQAIAKTGPQGAGSAAAREARSSLARHGVEILPRLLAAMDTPNNVAANWYRTIYEDIIARESAKPQPQFPVAELKAFLTDAKRQGKARRLVFALIERLEPQFPDAWIPTLLDDPEFRSDAVARTIKAGDAAVAAKDQSLAKDLFKRAFTNARQTDQVTTAAARLKSMGEEADVADHMGFIVDWYLIGPFDAPKFSGFAKVFPPEEKIDLRAEYPGQTGDALHWKRYRTPDVLGNINLNQELTTTKEAVGYAYSLIVSPRAQDAQLRCGADDNCSVWINGKKVFGRDQWLNGTRMDRFVTPVKLQEGVNHVLVKICQGPQHVDPAVTNNWSMQLRFCDASGGGVGLKSAMPAK